MKVQPAMVKSVSGRHLDILVGRLPGVRLTHIQADMEHKGLIQIQFALQELKVLFYALRSIYCCVAVLAQGLHSNPSRDQNCPFPPSSHHTAEGASSLPFLCCWSVLGRRTSSACMDQSCAAVPLCITLALLDLRQHTSVCT